MTSYRITSYIIFYEIIYIIYLIISYHIYLIISYNIIYHILRNHIVSYYISYHIIYRIIYISYNHIISYRIISYHISYRIISRASVGNLTKYRWFSAHTSVIAASNKIDEQTVLLKLRAQSWILVCFVAETVFVPSFFVQLRPRTFLRREIRYRREHSPWSIVLSLVSSCSYTALLWAKLRKVKQGTMLTGKQNSLVKVGTDSDLWWRRCIRFLITCAMW